MTLERVLLVTMALLLAVLQYGLMAHALLDLRHRPSVRGGNKVTWALLILCLPIAGAIIYSYSGPTSFIPRPYRPPSHAVSVLDDEDLADTGHDPALR